MKSIKMSLCTVLCAVIAALALAGCGSKPSGTYRSKGVVSQTFTFDGDDVTMSAFGLNASGTFEIDGDNITITYTLFGQEYEWSQSFSMSGDTITIGGTEFTKD